MPKYVKCPRCELNYILEGEELCDVCKAELHIGGVRLLEDDELDYNEEEGMLCPLCHTNFVEENEKYCAECLAKKNKLTNVFEEDIDDEKEDIEPDPTDDISLDAIEDWDDDVDSFDDDNDFISNDEDEEFEEDETSQPIDDDFEEIDIDDVEIDEDDDEDFADEEEDF